MYVMHINVKRIKIFDQVFKIAVFKNVNNMNNGTDTVNHEVINNFMGQHTDQPLQQCHQLRTLRPI